ncbi:MAG TPA: DUF2207 domain-containing protein [Vicinamibacterales bacterium]|nr:DUF2207 domain-containing protein [Vicinamibacterales bacterium]
MLTPSPRPPRPAVVPRLALLCLLAWLAYPVSALAQRELHWDRLDVTAHLEADGRLTVVETQTIVFTGDWNGGERTFNIRPWQSVYLESMSRAGPDGWMPMTRDASLDDVDDYAWANDNTVRWRSRRPSDPPFAGTAMRYRLAYDLAGILLKDGDEYRLDHDFAFPDRNGAIAQFELHLTLDPVWQPHAELRPVYTAGPLQGGDSFVLNIPLGFSGAAAPAARDVRRPREIALGAPLILGFALLSVLWFFAREHWYGRFAPLASAIDEAWLAEHIFTHPAEVVAAAWDENVGSAKVVSLIARMVADGTLDSSVGEGKYRKTGEMTLRLLVDRDTLHGHERVLVDKLFVDGSTVTSTSVVRAHYRKTGFNPSREIAPQLKVAVEQMLPAGRAPWRIPVVAPALCVVGLVLVGRNWLQGHPAGAALMVPMFVLAGVGWGAGYKFRGYLHWGTREALLCLTPALTIALGGSAYLWFYAASGRIELPPLTVAGLVCVILACIHSAIGALKSRRHRAALAFRKTLTAGRGYFMAELRKDQPALRDEWYPWLLAFELGPEMDAWSTARVSPESRSSVGSSDVARSTAESTSGSAWTGFGGGRSGGGGGGATWQAAASGMAATVSTPSSSSSSGGSGGSSGGSSSGGSSGGGGGGGW